MRRVEIGVALRVPQVQTRYEKTADGTRTWFWRWLRFWVRVP